MTDTGTTEHTGAKQSARPIIAVADHPVGDNELLLDADDLAADNTDGHIAWGRTQRVSDLQQAISSLENTASEHARRANRARETADTLRAVLHDAANETERPKEAGAARA